MRAHFYFDSPDEGQVFFGFASWEGDGGSPKSYRGAVRRTIVVGFYKLALLIELPERAA